MKILHLTQHLEIGGIPSHVVDLSTSLAAKGHQHQLAVASTGGPQVSRLATAGIQHLQIPLSSKFEFGPNLWRSWLEILPALRVERFDIVHAHTRIAQVLAGLIQRFHGVPSVTTCHGFFKPNLGRRIWPCWGQKVIVVSPAVAQQLKNIHGVDANKIICIPNGIDASRYKTSSKDPDAKTLRARLGIPDTSRIVGTAARVCPVKGLEYLVEGFAINLKDHPDLYCLIVGDGPSREALSNLAKKLGVANRVVFPGAVVDVAPYLALMEVFVLPSLMEGLGLSILEAFAAGKPVIASRVGGIVDVIRDRENGILIQPGSAQDVALSLDLLLSDRDLAARLAQSGKRTVQQDYSLERMTGQVEEVYASISRSTRA